MKMKKIILTVATTCVLGLAVHSIAQNQNNQGENNQDDSRRKSKQGHVVDPVAMVNLFKHTDGLTAKTTILRSILTSMEAEGDQEQREKTLAELSAAAMVAAMNTKSQRFRDAIIEALNEVADRLGPAMAEARGFKGKKAEDMKARIQSVVAAAIATTPAPDWLDPAVKDDLLKKFQDGVPGEFQNYAAAAIDSPAEALGVDVFKSVIDVARSVQRNAYPEDNQETSIVDVLAPSAASTTTTTTTTTTSTRPSPTPSGAH